MTDVVNKSSADESEEKLQTVVNKQKHCRENFQYEFRFTH